MTGFTNEELACMYQRGEQAEESFAQLINSLTPMMVKIGKYHLSACGIYDPNDYIQEGSLVLWSILSKETIRDKGGKLSSIFYTAFRNRCIRLYWNYARKNLFPVSEKPDHYHYGYQICTLVKDSHLEEHRAKIREQNERWYEKKYGRKHEKRQPVCIEERRRREEASRAKQKAYYLEHREENAEKKRRWYQENREYALLYQKAYAQGIRIGVKGPKGKQQ